MNSAEIWDELGNTCFKAEALDKAAEAFAKAIEHNSQSGWSYANLASIYVQKGRFTEAISLYQQSLTLFTSPKDQAIIWGRLGNIHHHLNEHGKAIQAYQKADEILPKRSFTRVKSIFPQYKSPIEQKKGDPFDTVNEKAEESPILERVEEPARLSGDLEENANVWNELGLILFKVGAYEDAIESYQKAINLQPDLGWLYSNLGQVYATQGKLIDAVRLYEISIKLLVTNKEKAVSWTRLGDIYRQLDKYDEAMAAYQLADALNQSVAVAINEFRQVDPSAIKTNQLPPRTMEDIDDLVVSVRKHGIIQPLIVCPDRSDPEKYSLIAGRRRLEAARRVGLKGVPVIVRQANDQEILELSLSENLHSSAINPFDLASGYRQMANEFDLSIEEISERIGRSPHSVANIMKVLESVDGPKTARPSGYASTDQTNLATLLLEEPDGSAELKGLPAVEPKSTPVIGYGAQTAAVGLNQNSEELETHRLWYLDTGEEAVAARQEDDYSSANTSLLVRARHVLKSNPHPKRAWTASSFRA